MSMTVKGDISQLTKNLNFDHKLGEGRVIQSPEAYVAALESREKAHLKKSYKPLGSIESLVPGTYYLVDIDDKYRRLYEKK